MVRKRIVKTLENKQYKIWLIEETCIVKDRFKKKYKDKYLIARVMKKNLLSRIMGINLNLSETLIDKSSNDQEYGGFIGVNIEKAELKNNNLELNLFVYSSSSFDTRSIFYGHQDIVYELSGKELKKKSDKIKWEGVSS